MHHSFQLPLGLLANDIAVTDQLDTPASNHFLHLLGREGLCDTFPVSRHILISFVADRAHFGSIQTRMFDNQPQTRLQIFEQLYEVLDLLCSGDRSLPLKSWRLGPSALSGQPILFGQFVDQARNSGVQLAVPM